MPESSGDDDDTDTADPNGATLPLSYRTYPIEAVMDFVLAVQIKVDL